MRRFVLGLFAAIGILTVLAIVGVGAAAWRLAVSKPGLPATIVLRADLDKGLAKGAGQDALADIAFGPKPNLRDFIDALDRAGGDPRVKGIYVRLGADRLALATCQELRDAIHAFRSKGKFAIAFATSFGEFGGGTRPYYLAAAFDRIWVQPLGTVGLTGLRAETPFFRGMLDRLGILPSFAHREQYKTAMNSLTETGMTPPQREEVEDLLGADARQIVQGIAANRKLSPQQVEALIDRGPLIAAEARKSGLVDRIGYLDQAGDDARQRAGSGAKFMRIDRYLKAAGRPHDSGPKIALIYATGLITEGDSSAASLFGEGDVTARKLARAFREAARDKDVRAILFRIDSPGGSAVASETIWREVERARQKGKPVVVSMGDVAGSGGYFIAAPADKIVAEPATLTGSIGVLAGKLVVSGLADKIGVSVDAAQRGANAAMSSAFEDFSPAAKQRLDAFLDDVYAGFKQHVASGRHLSADQVEAVAKGRVWTGAEAKEKGLVDALGGYDTALQLAREAAKIPAGQPFEVAVFPPHRGALERIYDRLHGDDEDDNADLPSSALGGRTLAGLRLLVGEARMLLAEPELLQMPPLGEIR